MAKYLPDYTTDDTLTRLGLQQCELERARNIADFAAAVMEYIKRAMAYSETSAACELLQLFDESYTDYLRYSKFNADASRGRMFKIVNYYALNRDERRPMIVDKWSDDARLRSTF